MTKKDSITAKNRVRGGVCYCMTFKKPNVSASESNERWMHMKSRLKHSSLIWLLLLFEAAAQISESGIPLEELEDHVKALMAEKETLQREIDDKRAILDGVDVDVESRRKIMEEYATAL